MTAAQVTGKKIDRDIGVLRGDKSLPDSHNNSMLIVYNLCIGGIIINLITGK